MYKNLLKDKWKRGKRTTGIIVATPVPALVEIAGLAGFDFVFIDAEHGPLSVTQCEDLVRAAEAKGIVPIIRVRKNDLELILRYMDIGAIGVIVPGVRNKEEADAVVRAIKYRPRGDRGLAATRSSDYGLGMPLKDYVKFANEETIALVSCENADAVENIEEILSVDDLDGAFIGANDLSQDLGVPAQTNHPIVQAAIERVEKKAFKTGKVLGTVVRAGETAQMYYDKGYLVVLTSALGLYASAAKAFVKATGEQ